MANRRTPNEGKNRLPTDFHEYMRQYEQLKKRATANQTPPKKTVEEPRREVEPVAKPVVQEVEVIRAATPEDAPVIVSQQPVDAVDAVEEKTSYPGFTVIRNDHNEEEKKPSDVAAPVEEEEIEDESDEEDEEDIQNPFAGVLNQVKKVGAFFLKRDEEEDDEEEDDDEGGEDEEEEEDDEEEEGFFSRILRAVGLRRDDDEEEDDEDDEEDEDEEDDEEEDEDEEDDESLTIEPVPDASDEEGDAPTDGGFDAPTEQPAPESIPIQIEQSPEDIVDLPIDSSFHASFVTEVAENKPMSDVDPVFEMDPEYISEDPDDEDELDEEEDEGGGGFRAFFTSLRGRFIRDTDEEEDDDESYDEELDEGEDDMADDHFKKNTSITDLMAKDLEDNEPRLTRRERKALEAQRAGGNVASQDEDDLRTGAPEAPVDEPTQEFKPLRFRGNAARGQKPSKKPVYQDEDEDEYDDYDDYDDEYDDYEDDYDDEPKRKKARPAKKVPKRVYSDYDDDDEYDDYDDYDDDDDLDDDRDTFGHRITGFLMAIVAVAVILVLLVVVLRQVESAGHINLDWLRDSAIGRVIPIERVLPDPDPSNESTGGEQPVEPVATPNAEVTPQDNPDGLGGDTGVLDDGYPEDNPDDGNV